jgi:membrane protein
MAAVMAEQQPSAVPAGSAPTPRARGGRRRPAKPRGLVDLPPRAWGRIARRTFDQARADGLTNLAAALTYRAVLSLFPGLIALVALLGLFGQYPQTFDAVLKIVGRVAPPSTVQTFAGPLRGVITNKGGAGALLGLGLVATIWAASGYVGAFSWATNVIWEARRGRSWYRQWPFNIAVTVVGLTLLTFVLMAAVLSGPIAEEVGRQLGLGSSVVTAWGIVKWPLVVLVVAGLIGVLYYIAPNVRQPPPRWLTPGAIFALVAWVVLTFGFAFYIANFGSLNKTYGTLGAIITFLIWTWFSNTAILLGVELDSEIERERQLAAGLEGAQEQIQLPLRQS